LNYSELVLSVHGPEHRIAQRYEVCICYIHHCTHSR